MDSIRAGMLALVLAAGWGCAAHVHMRGDGPHGEVIRGTDSEGATEADLGLPFYPGSTPAPVWQGGDTWVKMDGYVQSNRATDDSPSDVVKFYEDKLESPTSSGPSERTTLSGKLDDGADVTVCVLVLEGRTHISLAVTHSEK